MVDLLSAIFNKRKCRETYPIMIQCLEALIEFVQGPCKVNQNAISESKFLSIIQEMFSKVKTVEHEDT